MRRVISWSLLAVLSVTITALAFFPASYLVPFIETNTQGRITLGDVQGTLWQGSAFIAGSSAHNAAIAPLLPGRFGWQISPLVLIGFVDAKISNPAALSEAVNVTGSWRELTVSPSSLNLPAERLSSLGAPLNTLQPTGQMRLHWQVLRLNFAHGMADINGNMNLEMQDIASRLSPVKPLGAYNLSLVWRGQSADVALASKQGPLLLSGAGILNNGRLIFNGTAAAAIGHEEQLANLLNLLGQRRNVNGKDIIALELK